jgi:hypothetical protein
MAEMSPLKGRMAWSTQKVLDKRTYYFVGWPIHDFEPGVFRNVVLPGGAVMRLLHKGVYQSALETADDKLRELGRRSGEKEPSL